MRRILNFLWYDIPITTGYTWGFVWATLVWKVF